MAGLEDDLDACADRLMERLNAAHGDDAPFQQADPLELAARLMEVAAAQDAEPSPTKSAQEPSPAKAPAATELPGVAATPDGAACAAPKPAASAGRKSRGGGARRGQGSRRSSSRPGSAVAEARSAPAAAMRPTSGSNREQSAESAPLAPTVAADDGGDIAPPPEPDGDAAAPAELIASDGGCAGWPDALLVARRKG